MHKHRHVVVGGGFSGLRIARVLANRQDVEVVVINPQSNFEYHGSLYRSANGTSPLETVIPYREIFKDTNIEYIQDFMIDSNPSKQRITLLGGSELSYDSATLALGYEPEYFGIPGMREFSKTLYALADALELRKSLKQLAESHFHKSTPAKIIIAGAGPTGIETAAAIPHFFELLTGDRRVEITVIEAQSRILSALPQDFAQITQQSLASNIHIRCGTRVIRATKALLHCADSLSLPFDLLIWTAGSGANSYFRQRPDLFEVDRKGRALVDEHLQPKDKHMYVAGDSAAVDFSGTAYAAIEMGSYIAGNIISMLKGHTSALYAATPPEYAVPTDHESAVGMQAGAIITGSEGWALRRKLDLDALMQIMPDHVAHEHWLKGESLASMLKQAAA